MRHVNFNHPSFHSHSKKRKVFSYLKKKEWFIRFISIFKILCIPIVILVIITLKFLSVSDNFLVSSRTNYYILIDAGSHGSRLHIFSWVPKQYSQSPTTLKTLNIPQEIFSTSFSPGINSVSSINPFKAGELCISKLIEKAISFCHAQNIRDMNGIPIHLKATAGMRNIDALTRSRIMNSIREYLSNKSLTPFLFEREWARVIAGEEEGVYGWISVNQAYGTLLEEQGNTLGSLDLGGSSMQITFFPKHTSVIEGYYGLLVKDKLIRLYSHSFLEYGWDSALGRITTKIALTIVLEHYFKHNKVKFFQALFSLFLCGHVFLQAAIYSKEQEKKIVEIDGSHPCYPLGHTVTFSLPSLVYPEGRNYVDIDFKTLRAFMTSMGIPRDYHTQIMSQKGFNVLWPLVTESSYYDFNFHVSPHKEYFSEQEQPMVPDTLLLQEDHENVGNNMKTLKQDKKHVSFESLYTKTSIAFTPLDFPLPPNITGTIQYVINFKGTSDAKACLDLSKSLFYQAPCFVHSCSFNGVYQPRLENSRFIAMGQFSKIRKALNLSFNASPDEFLQSARRVCQKSRHVLKSEWKNGSYRPFGKKGIMNLCWKTIWIASILHWGYGFPLDSKNIYDTTDAFKNSSTRYTPMGWSIGSVIYEINRFPGKLTLTNTHSFTSMLFIILLILLLSILYLCRQLVNYQNFLKSLYFSSTTSTNSLINPSHPDHYQELS